MRNIRQDAATRTATRLSDCRAGTLPDARAVRAGWLAVRKSATAADSVAADEADQKVDALSVDETPGRLDSIRRLRLRRTGKPTT